MGQVPPDPVQAGRLLMMAIVSVVVTGLLTLADRTLWPSLVLCAIALGAAVMNSYETYQRELNIIRHRDWL